MADLGKIGWIFDGGGFTCARGAGMADACLELGIRPSYVQAVSGGIFNASKIVEKMDAKELRAIWQRVETKGPNAVFSKWYGLWNLSRSKNALFHHGGITHLFDNLDFKKIRESQVMLEIAVINESRSYRTDFFTNISKKASDDKVFKKMLYATTALMGFLPPARINNEVFSDGMYFDVKRAFYKIGCDTVFIFVNSPPAPRVFDPEMLGWHLRMRQCLRFAIKKTTNLEIKNLLQNNRDIYVHPHPYLESEIDRFAKKSFKRKNKKRMIVYVNPIHPIPTLELLSFKKGDISRAMEDAYKLTKEIASPLA